MLFKMFQFCVILKISWSLLLCLHTTTHARFAISELRCEILQFFIHKTLSHRIHYICYNTFVLYSIDRVYIKFMLWKVAVFEIHCRYESGSSSDFMNEMKSYDNERVAFMCGDFFSHISICKGTVICIFHSSRFSCIVTRSKVHINGFRFLFNFSYWMKTNFSYFNVITQLQGSRYRTVHMFGSLNKI